MLELVNFLEELTIRRDGFALLIDEYKRMPTEEA